MDFDAAVKNLRDTVSSSSGNDNSKVEDEKRRMLSDPGKLEKAVANMAEFYSPTGSTKKQKGGSYGIDSVEVSKDKGDPTVGFGRTLRDFFTNALLDPKNIGVSAGELLHKTTTGLMATPDNTGKSLMEKSYEFSSTEDSRLWGGVNTKKLPGYDAWKQDRTVRDKKRVESESWLPSIKDIASGVGVTAALGATAGGLGSGVAGVAAGAGIGAGYGLVVGGPVGAALGAVVGGVGGALGGEATGALTGGLVGGAIGLGGELLAAPIKKLVHKTDWYQGMIQSNSLADRAKAIVADMGAYLPGGLAAGGLTKSIGKAGVEGVAGAVEGTAPVAEAEKVLTSSGYVPEVDRVLGRQPSPFSTPSEPIERLLPGGRSLAWRKASADSQAAENIVESVANVEKAKSTIAASPTADNIIEAAGTVAKEVKPVDGSELVSMHEGLSSKGLQEAGLEEVTSPDVKPLEGPLADKIKKAYDRDTFAEIGKEEAGGKLRTAIAENSAEEIKTKLAPISNEDPIVETMTKVDPDVVVTPKQQEVAIKNTEAYSEGGRSVEKEYFPDAKIMSEQEAMGEYLKEVGAQSKDEVVNNIRNDILQSRRVATYMKGRAPEAEKINYINGEINSRLAEENEAFQFWAQDSGVKLPEHMNNPEYEAFTTSPVSLSDVAGSQGKEFSLADLKAKYYNSVGAADEAERATQLTTKAREELEGIRAKSKSEFMRSKAISEEEVASRAAKLIDKDNKAFEKFLIGGGEAPQASKVNLIAGMLAFGLGTSVLYDHLSGSKAEAGWLTASLSTVAKKGVLMEDALAKGLISKSITKETVMGVENFQKGLIREPVEVSSIVNANIRKGTGEGIQYSLMSPFQALEALFKTGAGKMVNAATELASFVTAGSRTKENALKVVRNTLNEAGIETNANAVREATESLVPLAARATKVDIAASQLKQAEERIAGITAKIKPNTSAEDAAAYNASIKVEQDGIAGLKGTLEELGGATKEYHDAHSEVMNGLASKYASVRVALAIEDPARKIYPWLPELNRTEEVAAGKIKVLLDQYRARLTERGIPVRDEYLPHSPHPEMAKIYNEELKDLLGGAPYQQFYSRTNSSRPLLPDIDYTMSHYLNDIEPRIQNHDFWERSGWGAVKNSDLVRSNPGLKKAFDTLYNGSKPAEQTWGNVAAQKYSEFEAVQKLFLSPSAGLKHLIKMTADIVSVGPTVAIKSLPDTFGYITRSILNKEYGINNISVKSVLEKLGVKSDRFSRKLIDDFMDSTIMSGNARRYMYDLGIDSQEQIFGAAKDLWKGVQNVGSTWINVAELVDRATSVSSALQMAGKRGMTVEQAMYGSYDLILKNNFLFGQFNPSWLNNPKIRAFLMFQATPFKIFERRLVNAQRSYANLGQLTEGVRKVIADPKGGWDKVWQDFMGMRDYMRDGQSELKSNLFIDTLRQETDFFGTPIVRQMATDIMTVAAATYGGAQAGLALSDHFFHIPFISTQSKEGKMELAVSPLVSGAAKGYAAWESRKEGEDFLLGSIMRRWLGPYGPLPQTLGKAVRLTEGDIPEIYRKGGGNEYLKYLFGVPGKE